MPYSNLNMLTFYRVNSVSSHKSPSRSQRNATKSSRSTTLAANTFNHRNCSLASIALTRKLRVNKLERSLRYSRARRRCDAEIEIIS